MKELINELCLLYDIETDNTEKDKIADIIEDLRDKELERKAVYAISTVPDWWLDNYTDASGNCFSDSDEGL